MAEELIRIAPLPNLVQSLPQLLGRQDHGIEAQALDRIEIEYQTVRAPTIPEASAAEQFLPNIHSATGWIRDLVKPILAIVF